MTIPEAYKTAELARVEQELLRIFTWYGPVDSEYSILKFNDEGRQTVDMLLDRRKELLDSMFRMDEKYKAQLDSFNNLLRWELQKMRNNAMETFYAAPVACYDKSAEIYVEARCYMDCKFSYLHLVQTEREQRMWAILTGALGYCSPLYKDGVLGYAYKYDGKDDGGENMLLYLGNEVCNWNNGLDPAMTSDMNLLYAFNNLHSFNWFSIFDLLWVRHFTTKITLTVDSHESNSVKTMDLYRNEGKCCAIWYNPKPISMDNTNE